MLEFGDVITLENNKEYIVASICEYEGQFYSYLVNSSNSEDCILGIIENDDLKPVQDPEVFVEVMPLILDNVDMSIFDEEEDNEQ